MILAWNAENRMRVLASLFALRGVIYLLDGILALLTGATYAEYGNALVMCVIYGFIAYGLRSSRKKEVLWLALLFSGIVLVRFLLFIGLSLVNGWAMTAMGSILAFGHVVAFGVIPLILLLQKDVRDRFDPAKGSGR